MFRNGLKLLCGIISILGAILYFYGTRIADVERATTVENAGIFAFILFGVLLGLLFVKRAI